MSKSTYSADAVESTVESILIQQQAILRGLAELINLRQRRDDQDDRLNLSTNAAYGVAQIIEGVAQRLDTICDSVPLPFRDLSPSQLEALRGER
jgi:hypothetical protein